MRRRDLLNAAGLALVPIGPCGWAAATAGPPKRLIVILLRGAVDGLSVVVPYAEEAYYAERRTIAIAPPGKPDGALPLDHLGQQRFARCHQLVYASPQLRCGLLAAGGALLDRSQLAPQAHQFLRVVARL